MNRFIMADAEKCIGCRTCEVACAVAHQDDFTAEAFTSRLRVVKGDAYTTAVGCHQCEDAPVPMSAQPMPSALRQAPGLLSRCAVLAVKAAWSPVRLGRCRYGWWETGHKR